MNAISTAIIIYEPVGLRPPVQDGRRLPQQFSLWRSLDVHDVQSAVVRTPRYTLNQFPRGTAGATSLLSCHNENCCGCPPLRWLAEERIRAARHLLLEGKTVVETASNSHYGGRKDGAFLGARASRPLFLGFGSKERASPSADGPRPQVVARHNENCWETADLLGFCNPFHFSRVFARLDGIPPSRFRILARQAGRK